MVIYLVRHGQTDWNVAYRLQGNTDIPLNENGISSAVQTGKGLKDIRFDACYCSHLSRSRGTAAMILGENRAAEKPEIVTDTRIGEYRYGAWEGLYEVGEVDRVPYELKKVYWDTVEDVYLPEGAEPKRDFYRRVADFLNDLYAEYADTDKNILVVTHGGVTMAVRYVLYGELKGRISRNCEVLLLTPENGKLIISDSISFA